MPLQRSLGFFFGTFFLGQSKKKVQDGGTQTPRSATAAEFLSMSLSPVR